MRRANNLKKLVFISSMASPHQVKLCYALAQYFDTRFWFYEQLTRERAAWWKVSLGDRCKILPRVWMKQSARYYCPDLGKELEEFAPDIILLGGFSIPGNYLAYRWGKRHGKKVLVFTERSRTPAGILRKRDPFWRWLRYLYKDVDLVLVSAEDAVPQFRDEFRFGDRVVASWYSADINPYFGHAPRNGGRPYTLLFPNRLTKIYNPVLALRIFREVAARHPGSRLRMNAAGELLEECRRLVSEWGMGESVEFLTGIRSWDDLPRVYAESDVMILPASFSNGNFTILEAMASGMGIVISNRILGLGKLIVDGVNGFNCEPETGAFVDRIERYYAQPDLFRTHASINRQEALRYTPEGTAKHFFELVSSRLPHS